MTTAAVPVGRARPLAQVYRHFGEVDAAGTSPLYERVAVALSESGEALRAIEAAPARKRHPTVILAALQDLALAGRAPALAAAYAAADGDAAAGAAIDTLLRMTDSVVAVAVRRPSDPRDRTLRRAVSGHRRGGPPGRRECGRADRRGCSAGLISMSIALASRTATDNRWANCYFRAADVFDRGRPAHPARVMPEVVARVGVDLDPVDVTDADDARWLRACVWPDQRERARGSKRRWRWRRRPLRCCWG